MARRFGSRIVGPFEATEAGWTGRVMDPPEIPDGASAYLLRDDEIVGTVSCSGKDRVVVGSREETLEALNRKAFYLVSAFERKMEPPFACVRGRMWDHPAPDLIHLADHEGDDKRSAAFVFEDNKQLAYPHAIHDDIDRYGSGRFSHWGPSIYFSSTDGTDPNSPAHAYRLLVAARNAEKDQPAVLAAPDAIPRSMAQQFGWPIMGPFEHSDAGWTGVIANASAIPNGPDLFLIEEYQLRGPVVPDAIGRVIVAPPQASEDQVRATAFHVVPGSKRALAATFRHERGFMWVVTVPDLESISDCIGHDERSPIFVFENGRQLASPHAAHDHIAWYGRGRFAHWNNSIYISATDNTNPNTNGRDYELFDPRIVAS